MPTINEPGQGQHWGGLAIIVAALGMTLGLIGSEVTELSDWAMALTPAFVGKSLIHLSTVIASAIGGNLIRNRVKK